MNLASVIRITDHAAFQNELYRNIDFCVVDSAFKPILFIEINDNTHNTIRPNMLHEARKSRIFAKRRASSGLSFEHHMGGMKHILISELVCIEISKLPPVRVVHSAKSIPDNGADENRTIPNETVSASDTYGFDSNKEVAVSKTMT